MTERLNVIALISGGKDSFYSLLHCLAHGHDVVALGNLCPATGKLASGDDGAGVVQAGENPSEEEYDLNSFMYQTVGHTIIPLYEEALGIPLYRQVIVGGPVHSGTSYNHVGSGGDDGVDETESLVPLLRRIMADHPTANALSTGAILSTYQRTRVESVALRLGLTPLGFLWKYPVLPPASQVSLLEDMEGVGLEARIIKVASGGLDESFLWSNVSEGRARGRIEKVMRRFGSGGDGAVLGEGGEFETLVVDGPENLFKGRIEVLDRVVVREGGGAAWLRITKARVVMKEGNVRNSQCRIPDLLESSFSKILNTPSGLSERIDDSSPSKPRESKPAKPILGTSRETLQWTVSTSRGSLSSSVLEQSQDVVSQITSLLKSHNLKSTNITCTTILIRSMADFATINKIYGTLFKHPNPPSRVTVSVGSLLPLGTSLTIHILVSISALDQRKALHVQSRSYWAPANIGPYSQAISIPSKSHNLEISQRVVSIAGQIPLIPHSMILPRPSKDPTADFSLQATLSLQHLHRIAIDMVVSWFTSAVAYLPISTSSRNHEYAIAASSCWSLLHQPPSDPDGNDDESRDLWEEKHYYGTQNFGSSEEVKSLPDWDAVEVEDGCTTPPFFALEVEGLPRSAGVEWHAHKGIAGGPI
ncbi:ATP binding L-PSP endoribonuclease family protein-like protein, partial [Amylocarpus encephaloides]